jgi:hypothetical protein
MRMIVLGTELAAAISLPGQPSASYRSRNIERDS